jgi:hypothetical protein
MCICREFAEPVNVQPEWVHLLLPGVYQCVGGAPRGGMGLRLVEGKEEVEAE